MSITRQEITSRITTHVSRSEALKKQVQKRLQAQLLDILGPKIRKTIENGGGEIIEHFIGDSLESASTKELLISLWLKDIRLVYYEREGSIYGQRDTRLSFHVPIF